MYVFFYKPQRRETIPNIKINNNDSQCFDNFNFLRLALNKHLGWADHVNKISYKISYQVIEIMKKLKFQLPQNIVLALYNSLILS